MIRFKGSDYNLSITTLGAITKEYKVSNMNVHHQNLLSLSYGKIIRKDINAKKGLLPASFDTYQLVKENIIVFRVTDLQNDKKSLRVAISKEEGIISPAYVCIECVDENVNPDYLFLLLHFYDVIKKVYYSMGDGMRQTLTYKDLKELQIAYPNMDKQLEIVDYFKKFDSLIQSTTKKIESLKQVKAASLQSMFPQKGETTPRVRFKGFEGEWAICPLKYFAKKSTEKNISMDYTITLTNSAEYGVINQRDFFDHDISKDDHINGYYVIHQDDFVYNPRVSTAAPVGPISRNLLGYSGVMSPLYLIFKVNEINKDYLSYYFKTMLWHDYMKLEGNTGARFDRLAISDEQFFNMPIYVPKDKKEQRAIASYFTTLDRQINLQSQRLEKLKHIKSACLDEMFV